MKNLYYAGSSTIPGIGLPMCLISAELVLKRVRGDVSAGPLAESLRVDRAVATRAVSFVYLGALLVSLAGMVVLDLRFRLFFAVAPVRAAIVLVAGIAFFLVWDLAGIGAGDLLPRQPGPADRRPASRPSCRSRSSSSSRCSAT